jgi:hypothetical protein
VETTVESHGLNQHHLLSLVRDTPFSTLLAGIRKKTTATSTTIFCFSSQKSFGYGQQSELSLAAYIVIHLWVLVDQSK